MNRRSFLATTVATLGARQVRAQEAVQRATRALPSPKIKDVQVIATAPAGSRLTVVKIVTDQDGLYGYGCGTFTQRAELVNLAVTNYLRPFLLGKPADRIDDLWQAMYASSYWRNGPVLNNAISGVDQALWDIKGRQAGMPVYELVGGKCREAAAAYSHASGADNARCIAMARLGEADRGVPQAARRRGGTAARHARALHAEPGGAVRQGGGALPPLLPRRSALARGHRLLPADPLAMFDADRDGRAVQQPARMDAADQRAADRLHPHSRVAGGRLHAVPQDR